MCVCVCVCACVCCIVADDTKWRRSCNHIWQGVDHKKTTSTERMCVILNHRSDIVYISKKCNMLIRPKTQGYHRQTAQCSGLRHEVDQRGKNAQGLRSANSRNSECHDCNTEQVREWSPLTKTLLSDLWKLKWVTQ